MGRPKIFGPDRQTFRTGALAGGRIAREDRGGRLGVMSLSAIQLGVLGVSVLTIAVANLEVASALVLLSLLSSSALPLGIKPCRQDVYVSTGNSYNPPPPLR